MGVVIIKSNVCVMLEVAKQYEYILLIQLLYD